MENNQLTPTQVQVKEHADQIAKILEAAATLRTESTLAGAFIDGVLILRRSPKEVALVLSLESKTLVDIANGSVEEMQRRADVLRTELLRLQTEIEERKINTVKEGGEK